MPTFSDKLTLNTSIMAVAMFFVALAAFQLGPFSPAQPRAHRTEPCLVEHRCDKCNAMSFFTTGQEIHCRQCSPQPSE